MISPQEVQKKHLMKPNTEQTRKKLLNKLGIKAGFLIQGCYEYLTANSILNGIRLKAYHQDQVQDKDIHLQFQFNHTGGSNQKNWIRRINKRLPD